MIPFLKEKLLENWILKISAIFLAWILWLFIQGESGTVTMVTAPVEVQVPPNMEISSGLPSTVQVTIRGASQALTCIINLQNAKEGEYKITLTEDLIKSPKGLGVAVSQVNPSQVVLVLEKTVKKQVSINVPVQGEVADGFEIYEKIPNPDVVEITGPRSHIESIEEVSTEIVALNGQKQSANFRVGLDFKNGMIRSSMSSPVWVEIQIGPRRKMFVVKHVPLILENKSYVSSPKQVDIRVMAPESLKAALVPDNFSATVAAQNLDEAELPLKVKPEISFLDSWRGMIKERGTIPSEVTIHKKDDKSSR
jgi:YbbR domain-containing protein